MKHFYKRHLPHFIVDDYAYFITSRLAGSLPQIAINDIKAAYDNELTKIASFDNPQKKREEYKSLQWNYFTGFDGLLNNYKSGPHWLTDDRIAGIVNDSLHYRDNKVYELIAYTIMSNHIHIVFIPFIKKLSSESTYKEKYPLSGLLASLKRFTATQANKILKREGDFWQHENYDHVIRDNTELSKIVEYVLNNPVKAGITEDIHEYKWNYYNPKYL